EGAAERILQREHLAGEIGAEYADHGLLLHVHIGEVPPSGHAQVGHAAKLGRGAVGLAALHALLAEDLAADLLEGHDRLDIAHGRLNHPQVFPGDAVAADAAAALAATLLIVLRRRLAANDDAPLPQPLDLPQRLALG